MEEGDCRRNSIIEGLSSGLDSGKLWKTGGLSLCFVICCMSVMLDLEALSNIDKRSFPALPLVTFLPHRKSFPQTRNSGHLFSSRIAGSFLPIFVSQLLVFFSESWPCISNASRILFLYPLTHNIHLHRNIFFQYPSVRYK